MFAKSEKGQEELKAVYKWLEAEKKKKVTKLYENPRYDPLIPHKKDWGECGVDKQAALQSAKEKAAAKYRVGAAINAVNEVDLVDSNDDDEDVKQDEKEEDGVTYDREIWREMGLVNGTPTLWCKKCGKAISKTQQLVDTHLSMDDHKRKCGQLIIDDD